MIMSWTQNNCVDETPSDHSATVPVIHGQVRVWQACRCTCNILAGSASAGADYATCAMISHVVEEIEHVYETVEHYKECAEDLRGAYVCLKVQGSRSKSVVRLYMLEP